MGETSKIFIMNRGKAEIITERGYVYYTLINPDIAGTKDLTVSYLELSPGSKTIPSIHPNTEEAFFITRGRGIITVSDQSREVQKGDAIFISKNLWHEFENTGDEPMEWLCIYPGDLAGSKVTRNSR